MGFVIDVVGYGLRSSPAQERVQARIRALLDHMLDAINIEFDETEHDAGSGDGMAVFLPINTDPTHALPSLLRATAQYISADNDQYRDRIQLRMATGFGLVGIGPLGFTGPLIMHLSRLNDNAFIRQIVHENKQSDVAALVSEILFEMLRSAHLPQTLGPLRRVEVTTKEFSAAAWLWIGPPHHQLYDAETRNK